MPAKLTGKNYKIRVAELEQKFGPTVKIAKGDGATAMHPLEGKPVIALS